MKIETKKDGTVDVQLQPGMIAEYDGQTLKIKGSIRFGDGLDGFIKTMPDRIVQPWKPQIGEVVKSEDCIFIYDGQHCGYAALGGSCVKSGKIHEILGIAGVVSPTTREERIGFFAALEKAGYKYNSKKKELKKVSREYRAGDFVVSKDGGVGIIEKKEDSGRYMTYCRFVPRNNDLRIGDSDTFWTSDFISGLANCGQINQMHAELKEAGYKWNAEEKKVDKIRWRAERGAEYEHISILFGVPKVCRSVDVLDPLGKSRFVSGNYFKPGTAKKVADEINAIFERNKQ